MPPPIPLSGASAWNRSGSHSGSASSDTNLGRISSQASLGDDADAITTKTNALAQASMKLGEAMYKQAAEQQAGGGSGGGETAGGDGKKEDVVDAEFTEVDDDKKNKKSA